MLPQSPQAGGGGQRRRDRLVQLQHSPPGADQHRRWSEFLKGTSYLVNWFIRRSLELFQCVLQAEMQKRRKG